MLLALHLPKVCRCLAIERYVGRLVSGPQRLPSEQAQGVPLTDLLACQCLEDAQHTLMERRDLQLCLQRSSAHRLWNCQRQGEPKRRALPWAALDAYLPLMVFNDGLADVQPQSQANA
jgi:hypothetical protein